VVPPGGATLANQELIKDGGDGDFLTTDSLHDIKAAIGGSTPAISGTHIITAAHGTAEQTIVNLSPSRSLSFCAYFDVQTLIDASEGGEVIFRLKLKVDGTNLREIDISSFLVGTDSIHPSVSGWSEIGTNTMSLTVQCSSAVTVDRNIPYKILGGI
jgi:hypothetical protein